MRTEEEIITTMDETQASQPALSGLTSTSQNSIFGAFKKLFAKTAQTLEGLWDNKQEELEAKVTYAAPASAAWLRNKAFEFQYDETAPQKLVLKNDVPVYEKIDPSKRLISRCFFTAVLGIVELRVAKNDPPVKMLANETESLNGYFSNTGDGIDTNIGFGYGGQSINCVSYDPDKLYLKATIRFSKSNSKTIQADTISAIEKYASNVGVAPIFKTTTLIDILQEVPGFVDIFIEDLRCRPYSTDWPGGTDLVISSTFLQSQYEIFAGYMVGETETGQTLADKLTFTGI